MKTVETLDRTRSGSSSDRALLDARHVHFVGVGGVGVSAIARVFFALGKRTTGSDRRESQLTRALRALGVGVTIGHEAVHVEGADVVVHSTAVPHDNVELARARELGIPVLHRSQALGSVLTLHREAVGVMGTHGKGTVSAMLTLILDRAGRAPSFVIGARLENYGLVNARLSSRDVVVAEVDESDGSMVNVHPTTVVLTNLEPDHLHYYRDLAHLQDSLAGALHDDPRLSRVVINGASPGLSALLPRLPDAAITRYGVGSAAALLDVRGTEVRLTADGGSFVLERGGQPLARVELAVPGAYNVENAVAAAAAGLALGVAPATIARGLADYRGLQNRFTAVEVAGRRVIKDFTSHPTAFRHVIHAAAREGRPIVVVLQPWRYSLLRHLFDEYVEAFVGASHMIIGPIDGGDEVPLVGFDGVRLASALRARDRAATEVAHLREIPAALDRVAATGTQVIFFGGEELFALADDWAGGAGGAT